MKKEFLDYLYEQITLVQTERNKVREYYKKYPMKADIDSEYIRQQQKIYKEKIQYINEIIEKYLKLYTNS